MLLLCFVSSELLYKCAIGKLYVVKNVQEDFAEIVLKISLRHKQVCTILHVSNVLQWYVGYSGQLEEIKLALLDLILENISKK